MKKTFTLFVLLLLTCVCPAVAQQKASIREFTMDEGENPALESASPIRLYSSHSYSQTLLTSDMLSGLKTGSKITGLKLQSAQTQNSKDFNFDLKVWIMNTADDADNVKIDPHSGNLKQVYSVTLVQRYHGYYADKATPVFENFIDIVFDEPFVYEGQNLRIAMKADIEDDGYQQTYFKALRNVKTSWQKSSDNPKIDGVAVDIMDYTWASSPSQTPIFTFVVDDTKTVTVNVDPAIGYTTFYDSKHAVKIPEGVEVYVMTQLVDMEIPGMVEYAKLAATYDENFEGVVPAGEPIILKASGDVTLEYTEAPSFGRFADARGINHLSGSDADAMTTVPAWAFGYYRPDQFYYYALGLNDESDPESVGFYWMNETGSVFVNKRHEAYFTVSKDWFTGEPMSAFLFSADVTNGIKNISSERHDSKLMYNIAGQQVDKDAKGIIIKNGKKVLIKK